MTSATCDFNPDVIPPDMAAIDHWLLWKWVHRPGDPKPTKPPFDVRTGRPGDATDPTLWLPLAEALKHLKKYDGLGFAIGGTPFTGVDIDNCRDEAGNISAEAREIVEELNSYTEGTPSGKGLRVWLRGKLPPGRRRKGSLEFYDEGRYFTVTGDHLDGTPTAIANREKELHTLHARIFPQAAKGRPGPIPARPTHLGDRELLERMFRAGNGRVVEALFAGDLGKHTSGSEADLALCSHLAFWTGNDPAAIERLFGLSALCDAKWLDRPDYRARTIAKACENSATYDPSYRGNGHAKAAGKPDDAGPGEPPREPGDDGDDPAEIYHRTDRGNARRLVTSFGDDLRYCHVWGKWLAWDEGHWRVDESGQVYRFAHDVIAAMHAEAAAADDEAIRKVISAWAMACESEKRINSMVSLARHERGVSVAPAQLDAWPMLLNGPSGTVCLRTGRLLPHVREDLLAKRTAAAFDARAACPAWEGFLARIMAGDEEMIGFLRRSVGYAITGDVSEHALFFLYGTGRNGKSTFLNTLGYVLGDYAITVNADLLTAKGGDDHPTGLADLQGRRFVATIEVEDGKRMAEALVKTLTGGDRIRARRMRQDFYEFDPCHKLFLAANHKPTVRGNDEGIWRRIKLIPFKVQIPPEEVDKSLPEKLKAEAPGILAWAVRGCLEWQSEGLRVPAAVAEATADYKAEMDVLADFLDEKCIVNPDQSTLKVKAGELYGAYADWCKSTGSYQLSMRKLGLLLTERGHPADKSGSVNWRLGIGLIQGPEARGFD